MIDTKMWLILRYDWYLEVSDTKLCNGYNRNDWYLEVIDSKKAING